jgi:hypothetical protein
MANVLTDGDQAFAEFRRKVQEAEVLSAAMERLLPEFWIQREAQRGRAEWTVVEVRL